MNKRNVVFGLVLCCVLFFSSGTVYAQEMSDGGSSATLLTTGLEGGSGSTIGPDGALYVTEGATGRISRVDLQTGNITTVANGLPPWIIGLGGAMDVAFIGETPYALVTLVGEDVGGGDVVGIYRVDGPNEFTVIADIGEFATQNVPTNTLIEVPSGVQYALEPYRDGFLVTDGHHNRVLQVTLDGEISELIAFDNIVPTGLALEGNMVYLAEAGPVPHLPEHGKVVSFAPQSPTVSDVASGARLLVDVEVGPDGRLYALSQGDWSNPDGAGSPAEPNTGTLLAAGEDGAFTVVADGLDRPTSLEFVGNTAYVVTIAGEVWTVDVPGTCTLSTIAGTYVFHAQGVVVDNGEALPYAEAGMLTLDGAGSGAGFVSASVSGEFVARGEAFTATYELVSDCMYSAMDETGTEVDLYTTPSGDIITYSSAGVSGVMYRP